MKPEHAQLWTKPGGLEIDTENAADILGGDPNGFLALFADGSIRTLDPNMDPAMLKALLTVAGGEEIDASKLPGTDYPAHGIESDPGVAKKASPGEGDSRKDQSAANPDYSWRLFVLN